MKNNNHEQITETRVPAGSAPPSQRAEALAIRLENGATALAALASTLSDGRVADPPAQGRPEDRRGRTPRGQYVPN